MAVAGTAIDGDVRHNGAVTRVSRGVARPGRWFAAVLAASLLGGCVSGTTGREASPTPTPVSPPAATDSTATATPPPGGPGPTTPPRPRTTTASTGETGDPNDEVPRDPIGAGRTLSGTVQRTGSCTILVVRPGQGPGQGSRRWALTGAVAAGLRVGQSVTVSGHVTPAPPACDGLPVTQAMRVTRATTP
jgi:hypothetical protein